MEIKATTAKKLPRYNNQGTETNFGTILHWLIVKKMWLQVHNPLSAIPKSKDLNFFISSYQIHLMVELDLNKNEDT